MLTRPRNTDSFLALSIVTLISAPLFSPLRAQDSTGDDGDLAERSEAVELPDYLARPVVIGASVSDGYGLKGELGINLDFADLLQAALGGKIEKPKSFADVSLYSDPLTKGTAQVDEALEADPTLLVAVDYLFWFGYGMSWGGEDRRLKHLELGLEQLSRYRGPLIVGDFPDASAALEGVGPFGAPLLTPSMIPEPETLAQLNARVEAWAEERGQVSIVSLGDFLDQLRSGNEIELRGDNVPAGSFERLMQRDLLHPKLEGVAGLAVVTWDVFLQDHDDRGAELVTWSPTGILEHLRAIKAEELEEAAERQRRREERARKREERKRDKEGSKEGPEEGPKEGRGGSGGTRAA